MLANFTTSFERIIPAKNTIIAKASTGRAEINLSVSEVRSDEAFSTPSITFGI